MFIGCSTSVEVNPPPKKTENNHINEKVQFGKIVLSPFTVHMSFVL